MFGLAGLKLYGAIAGAVVIALFLAWVWRIDSLRAEHKKALVECQARYDQFMADVKARTEQARLADAAHKAEVEHNQDRISKESDHDIRARIAAAVAAVHNRVQLTPAVHPGSRGSPAVSVAPFAPAGPAGAGQAAVVPAADLEVCAANTVKAEGWQSWWKDVQAAPR